MTSVMALVTVLAAAPTNSSIRTVSTGTCVSATAVTSVVNERPAYDLSPIIRRYGKELLLKVLGS